MEISVDHGFSSRFGVGFSCCSWSQVGEGSKGVFVRPFWVGLALTYFVWGIVAFLVEAFLGPICADVLCVGHRCVPVLIFVGRDVGNSFICVGRDVGNVLILVSRDVGTLSIFVSRVGDMCKKEKDSRDREMCIFVCKLQRRKSLILLDNRDGEMC